MNNSLLYYFLNSPSATSGSLIGSVPMFLPSANVISSGIPLYLKGTNTISGAVPLSLIGGVGTVSGTVSLYTSGLGVASGTLPLYLQGPTYTFGNQSVDLSLQGSTSGYNQTFSVVPLYISGVGQSGTLNLYLYGQSVTHNTSGSLNLSLSGGPKNTVNSNVSLSLTGIYGNTILLETSDSLSLESGDEIWIEDNISFQPIFNSIPLFIQGFGGLNGSLSSSGSLNLFLQNNYTALTSSINLYAYGNTNTSGSVNMYLYGVQNTPTSGVNLYMYGVGNINKNVNLFIRGYID